MGGCSKSGSRFHHSPGIPKRNLSVSQASLDVNLLLPSKEHIYVSVRKATYLKDINCFFSHAFQLLFGAFSRDFSQGKTYELIWSLTKPSYIRCFFPIEPIFCEGSTVAGMAGSSGDQRHSLLSCNSPGQL